MLFLNSLLTSYWLIFNQSQTQVHFLGGFQFASCLHKIWITLERHFSKDSHDSFAFGLGWIYIYIFNCVCLYSHIWYCFRAKYKNQKPPSWFWKDSKWKESGIFLKVLIFWYLHLLWFLANSYNGWIIKCLNFSKELHCTIYQFVKLLCKNKTLVFTFFMFLGQITV